MSQQIVTRLAHAILKYKKDTPLLVGIDGIDAAGKTFLADEIASYLVEIGHPVIRASIDGFHNPRSIRHKRGLYSPEGYYYDSFNYESLKSCLLEPFSPDGNRRCCSKVFDFKIDAEIFSDEIKITDTHILIFEGVFLFRHEIERYWDLKIFVDIDFQVCIKRAIERDLYLFGDENKIIKMYQERYIPGQKIYIGLEKPCAKADIVINNNDFENPSITFQSNP